MHRRATPGPHFILGQARPTGACRSTQTLDLTTKDLRPMNVPRLFQLAGLVFFLLGLLAVPVGARSAAHGAYYKIVLYLGAAIFFWAWLYRDAATHQVSRSWQLLVGAGWLVAAIPVVPVYLLATRGWRRGSMATLAMLAIVFVTFALLGAGMLISVSVANAFGYSASEA